MGSNCGKNQLTTDPALFDSTRSRTRSFASDGGSSQKSAPSSEGRSEKRRSTGRAQFVLHNAAEIDAEYDVGEKAGEGTQGVVFRATRRKTGVGRAVKKVPKQTLSGDKLAQEIAFMKKMDHPNIIKLYETFDDRTSTFLVMELCSGGELFDKVVEQGSLSEMEAALVLQEILRAVHYLHEQNIAHRDLKPENFLFTSKGPIDEDNFLKLIDFGVACECGPTTILKEVVGTPFYVAPQVITMRYDKMCDLWSCGVVMFTLLTGNVPFQGNSDSEVLAKVREGIVRFSRKVWSGVSDDAQALTKKLLTRSPKDRFTAAQALDHDWIKNRAPTAMPKLQTELIDRLRDFRRRNQLKQAALSIVANEMSDEQIRHLRETFTALDANRDGLLTYAEVRVAVEEDGVQIPHELDELFKDQNEIIDYTEFLAATLDIRANCSEEAIRMAFGVFDVDGSGRITHKEVSKAFQAGCSKQKKQVAECIVNRYSTKGDGAMDFEDFRDMMQSDFSPQSRPRSSDKECETHNGSAFDGAPTGPIGVADSS